MSEQTILTTIGALPVTAYGLIIALAAGAGFLWMHWNARRIGLPADTAVRFGLWAIPLGLVFGRSLFVLLRWNLVVDVLGWQHIFMFWDGGFALFGVLPGCLLAAFCCARSMRFLTADILDAAAPGAALALGIARFAEVFTLQGVGRPVDLSALQWFPVAVQNSYGEWVTPVFFWEGAAALVIAWFAARALRNPRRAPLDATCVFLLGLGITQVLLESLRTDDILRLGLVKVSQLAAMTCVLAAAVRWAVPAIRAGKFVPVCAYGAGLLAGVGLCTCIEYALDKTAIPNAVLYLAMALTLAIMAALVGRLRKMAAGHAEPASGKRL
jgi:phosphatidylglycerol---prolipoprotein diacylglyceryl transferase